MSVFDAMLTDIFASNIAAGGTYTAPGGQPVPVRVVKNIADRETAFHPTSIQSPGAGFDIQVSALGSAPQKGGTLIIDGITYVINSTPQKKDTEGLIWRVTAPPQ